MFDKRIIILSFLLLIFEFSNLKEIRPSQNEIEKIKKGLFLDSFMLSQNQLFYNKTLPKVKEKEENLNRKLEENEITLKDVGFFAYEIGSPTKSVWSYINIFTNM